MSKKLPGYSDYVIFPDGRVLNEVTNTFIEKWVGSTGYFYVKLKNDEGKSKNVSLHRSLMMLYGNPPYNHWEYIINHKDGNKQNFALDNMEWTTLEENILHAYRTGLRPSHRDVVCLDSTTGKEHVFSTLVELRAFFKLTDKKITGSYKLNGKITKTLFAKSLYDETSWSHVMAGKRPAYDNVIGVNGPFLAFNHVTKEQVELKNLSQVRYLLNADKNALKRRAEMNDQYPLKGWSIAKKETFTQWKEWGLVEFLLHPLFHSVPVVASKENDNFVFPSILHMYRELFKSKGHHSTYNYGVKRKSCIDGYNLNTLADFVNKSPEIEVRLYSNVQ